jgi:hypothetical protein
MEALFGRDYYDNVPNLMKKDYEGKGKVPYFKKRDPEGATLERGTIQALADFERETPWSNENGETSHRSNITIRPNDNSPITIHHTLVTICPI